jgi:folate-binding protein YgfZ
MAIMTDTPSLARLHDRALVAVEGDDWRTFLQGLLTQDIETLAVGELRYGALLTPQGRLLFDLFILGTETGALLDVEAARRDEFIQRLSMYRLRAKATMERAEGGVFVLWDAPAAPTPWIADPRLAGLGYRAYARDAPAAQTAEASAYDAHRLALGVPDPIRDCAGETTYPIEANLDLLNGIDFKKGCYVGQETTSRMKRRGQIKSRMLPLTFDGPEPPPGAEVLAEGSLRAGEVRSVAPGLAMALMRLDRASGADITVDGRPVNLAPPEWLTIPDS